MEVTRGFCLRAALAAAALGLAACGGGERQDADEPEGSYRVEVADASFPRDQQLAERSTLRLVVRNADDRPLPNVSVTLETEPGERGGAAHAFAQDLADPTLADAGRPVWILDKGPVGGETAYTNTWSLGRLEPGQSREFKWRVTAVKAGDYTVDYTVSPGLHGVARPADGSDNKGSFRVRIEDDPPVARVAGNGKVVRVQPRADNDAQ